VPGITTASSADNRPLGSYPIICNPALRLRTLDHAHDAPTSSPRRRSKHMLAEHGYSGSGAQTTSVHTGAGSACGAERLDGIRTHRRHPHGNQGGDRWNDRPAPRSPACTGASSATPAAGIALAYGDRAADPRRPRATTRSSMAPAVLQVAMIVCPVRVPDRSRRLRLLVPLGDRAPDPPGGPLGTRRAQLEGLLPRQHRPQGDRRPVRRALVLYFLIAGLFAMLMRVQLAQPGGKFVDANTYNGLFSGARDG